MLNLLNLTPHPITIHTPDEHLTIHPSGQLARIIMDENLEGDLHGVTLIRRKAGEVQGLPTDGTPCLVSSMVLDALPDGTKGVYAPDTGPTAVRNEKGQIVAVTRLVCK